MKIVYPITAFNQFEHLGRLIKAPDYKDAVFFIHIDKKVKIPKNIRSKRNIIFVNRIVVWWGGWSHQQAMKL